MIVIQEVPKPLSKDGWVIVKVKAFGLNRAELFTRQNLPPMFKFPLIQGIECVGEVEDDPSGTYKTGKKVAAVMGGMGRYFDGSYAEYVSVPFSSIFPFESDLPWLNLGAIPEMFQTASGSLIQALEVKKGEVLLIRGGTSSIGMLTCQLAKHYGLTVITTTRKEDKINYLKENGADHVLIDNGNISSFIRDLYPTGIDKVLELVGPSTLKDSLKCIKPKGIVCITGLLAGEFTLKEFSPMGDIPSLGKLTVYMGDAENLDKKLLQDFIDAVADKSIRVTMDKTFRLEEIAKAHIYMESNQSKGKIVIEVQ